jgi:tRNA threonylcarbamoyladenosine modification (KEOPS) complex  Pcc1 subunit
MKAVIEIGVEHPDQIIKAIEPDIDQNEKFDVKLEEQEGKIVLTVEAREIAGLLAGINSYVKLIRVALDVGKIE